MTTEILLCSPTRTAIGAFDGSLKTIPVPDLGAVVMKETLKRNKLPADKAESVIKDYVVQAYSPPALLHATMA